jgi:NCS1 family nucleobase:cation symporter-1
VLGILPSIPGFLMNIGVLSGLPPIWGLLYDLSWFVGVAVSSVVYCLLMRGAPGAYADSQVSLSGGGSPAKPDGASA